MADTKKVRVEYYQVVVANVDNSGKDELFDLRKLITKVEELSLEDRTYPYNKEEARLDKRNYNKDYDFWYISFVRLRQDQLPVKALKNSEAESMHLSQDEYIGEEVTAVYDCQNHIIALQRNRDSLSSVGIEAYLTRLYDRQDKGIFLRAVPMEKIFERAGKAKLYRKIVIKFASDRTEKRNINSSFSQLFTYFDRFETSRNATVTLSVGTKKKASLGNDAVTETLKDIKEARESGNLISGAELTVQDTENARVEVLDLFAMKYHSFVDVPAKKGESIDYLECADKICEIYLEKREEILGIVSRL